MLLFMVVCCHMVLMKIKRQAAVCVAVLDSVQ